MKVWITKYALTQGILEREAERTRFDDMISVKTPNSFTQYFHKDEWFADKQDAIKKAEAMRDAKIKSLDKAKQKILKIKFD